MDKEQAALVRMRLNTFKTTLVNNSQELKTTRATVQLVEFFNRLRADAVKLHDKLATNLPYQLTTNSRFNMVGQTDVTYLELEALTDQILETIAFFENRQ